jgi:hypothetical protein
MNTLIKITNHMRKKILPILTLVFGLFLWGCYPNGPSYTEDLDLVVTYHNPDYDFVAKGTYAMPDKIVKITGNLASGEAPTFIPDAIASQILTRIATNMENLGWQKVAFNSNPDLLLNPASWETTTVVYWYDYWYWWYGGYYPGWGGGYYPPVYADSYQTGTLLMVLSDPKEVGGNGNPITQWTGAVNGILTSKFDAGRINPLIDKAFTQSPYLKTN